jgi:hypothetical protein
MVTVGTNVFVARVYGPLTDNGRVIHTVQHTVAARLSGSEHCLLDLTLVGHGHDDRLGHARRARHGAHGTLVVECAVRVSCVSR